MFCSSCGKEVAQGNTLCPNCGKVINALQSLPNQSLVTEEEALAEIRGAQEVGFGKGANYDLYLTASRLVAIRMTGAAVAGGAAFGIAGMLAERAIKNRQADKKRERMDSLSLDQMLQSDKKNYQISYESIQSFKLVSNMMQKLIEVRYANEEKKRYAVKKDAIQMLQSKLPSVRALEGKLEMPK